MGRSKRFLGDPALKGKHSTLLSCLFVLSLSPYLRYLRSVKTTHLLSRQFFFSKGINVQPTRTNHLDCPPPCGARTCLESP